MCHITIEKLLKGEIKTYFELDKINLEDDLKLQEDFYSEKEINQTRYSILIKEQYDNQR
ncbi:hypothetical protein [Moheibacter stercoris]|uniref:Uncharacterized protein n=1 Tax=Moheibacter stercoris TaxID=1628251 RepID=A0ABV2LPI2_9FLAO